MTEELSSKRDITKYQCHPLTPGCLSSVRKVEFTQPYKALFSIDICKLVSGLFPVNCRARQAHQVSLSKITLSDHYCAACFVVKMVKYIVAS